MNLTCWANRALGLYNMTLALFYELRKLPGHTDLQNNQVQTKKGSIGKLRGLFNES